MQIKFWGVRGSIPSPYVASDIRWKLRGVIDIIKNRPELLDNPEDLIKSLPSHLVFPVGGNTSCLEIQHRQTSLILDMGSGIRPLGTELSARNAAAANDKSSPRSWGKTTGQKLDLTIFLSHTHWDHIQGFPFFTPAYTEGNRITIYGLLGESVREALNLQQTAPTLFPLALNELKADINCLSLPSDGLEIGGIKISFLPMPHPGGSLAYRFQATGQTIIYATDYEFINHESKEAQNFVKFITRADILISDTQYTYLEGLAKEGWGHSTSFSALEMGMRAGVKKFFLFHHDPDHSDAKLYESLNKTIAYYKMISNNGPMNIELAIEGKTVTT